mmetsp:Transcript_14032/g.28852  ORF Transcript_14032/g.28852 Transcript_14032/m.28852 type:complete len:233 (+) Transcript_14032:635-1333(+)
MLLSCDRHAARHGTSQHLVPRNCDRVNGLSEGHLRCEVNEGHHHCKEGAIAVDVEAFARNIEGLEDAEDAVEVVDGALDGGADVDVDDDWAVDVLLDLGGKDVVVDLSHGEGGDGLGVHAVVPGGLEDGVVCLLGGIEDAVGVALPGQEDAVEVALRSAGANVSPVLVLLHLPKTCHEVDHSTLKLPRVHAVVRGDVRVPEVVDAVLHELIQLLVVVHQIVRVPEMHGTLAL